MAATVATERSGMRGRERAMVAGLALLVSVGVAACGSSSTVGTAGDTTSTTGPLVARLTTACGTSTGVAIDHAGNAGVASADAALAAYLAEASTDSAVRALHFEPAAPPPLMPVTSVGPDPTMSTTTTTEASSATTTAPSAQWYVHVDDQGRVTAVILVTHASGGWQVDQVQYCTPGAGQDSTATTGAIYRSGADQQISTTTSPP
jgi:hypothetical protein